MKMDNVSNVEMVHLPKNTECHVNPAQEVLLELPIAAMKTEPLENAQQVNVKMANSALLTD